MATVVTHGTVEWTITETVTQGTFVNGEPYIVVPAGTVTVESYTPTTTTGRNGSMKNNMVSGGLRSVAGSAANGYDNRATEATYANANNIAHDGSVYTSFTLTANDMLITADSATTGDGAYDNIDTFGLLTVLASAPAANSFRPPWCGWDGTTFHNESDLDYTALPNLDPAEVAGEPTKATYAAYIYQKVWMTTVSGWYQTKFHPILMAGAGASGYGRPIAQRSGAMAMLLCLSDSDANKRDLLVGLIQFAIDNQGIIDDGGNFNADGGIYCGRLSPHLIAAMVLNDSGMKAAMTADKFQESQQTFYVDQDDVDNTQVVYPGKSYTVYQYEQADLNKPAWGVRYEESDAHKTYISNSWDASYQDIAGGVTPEPALVMHLLNARSVVNSGDALFDYAQRHIYYRNDYYANPIYYNGWDDGDSYGDGNTASSTPWSSNETTTFATNMFLAFENADPVGSVPALIRTQSASNALLMF
jgi:hypothetical protein